MSKKTTISIIIALLALALIAGVGLGCKRKQEKATVTEKPTTTTQGPSSQTATLPATPKPLPESVIKMDVVAQNNHDWQSYLAIRTAKPGPPENRNDLMILKEKYPQNIMMENIERAQLVGVKSLPLSLAGGLTRIDKYLELYSEIRAYYVGINYKLKQEKRHLYNGVNYRLYILCPEDGNCVIIEASEAPVHRMIEAGYGFCTPEESTALRIQEERQRTGKFINAQGEIIPD